MTDDSPDPADRLSVEEVWQSTLESAEGLPYGEDELATDDPGAGWARRYTKFVLGDPSFLAGDVEPGAALSTVEEQVEALPPSTFAAGALATTRIDHSAAADLDRRHDDWAGTLVGLAERADSEAALEATVGDELGVEDEDARETLAEIGSRFADADDAPVREALVAAAAEGLRGERPGPMSVAPGATESAAGPTDDLADRETSGGGHPAEGSKSNFDLDRR